MQLRRIALLFALVLGLVAVMTALAPPPEERDEDPAPPVSEPSGARPDAFRGKTIRLSAPPRDGRGPLRRVATGKPVTVEVRVRRPADVSIDGLGLRQTADPLAPARFDLLARPTGTYDVLLHPLRGDARRIARLVFEERAGVRLRTRGRP